MRLLCSAHDGRGFKLTKFQNDSVPPYAILSHTWGSDEITFEDLSFSSHEKLRGRDGYQKITFMGRQIRHDALQYFWIDTCCIDQANSDEVMEAINSMFRWYSNATKCYVFLSDYYATSFDIARPMDEYNIGRCRWFSRGWTLQELLAPRDVQFVGYRGDILGTKEDMLPVISRVTGVPECVLRDGHAAFECSIAQRMSWAVRRNTTKPEDRAYCLLGIFNVSLPLLYGEGERAFVRLQEEILKRYNDITLLAWSNRIPLDRSGGVLAQSIDLFGGATDLVLDRKQKTKMYLVRTGSGASLLLATLVITCTQRNVHDHGYESLIAVLPCFDLREPDMYLGLLLVRKHSSLPWGRTWEENEGLIRVPRSYALKATRAVIEVDTGAAPTAMGRDIGGCYFSLEITSNDLAWNSRNNLAEQDLHDMLDGAIGRFKDRLEFGKNGSKHALLAISMELLNDQERDMSNDSRDTLEAASDGPGTKQESKVHEHLVNQSQDERGALYMDTSMKHMSEDYGTKDSPEIIRASHRSSYCDGDETTIGVDVDTDLSGFGTPFDCADEVDSSFWESDQSDMDVDETPDELSLEGKTVLDVLVDSIVDIIKERKGDWKTTLLNEPNMSPSTEMFNS